MTATTPTAALGPRYKWIALSNTTLGVLMAMINQSIVLIALPNIFRGIELDPLAPANSFYLLWMILGYLVVSSVLIVSLGRLGDIFGRVRTYNLLRQAMQSTNQVGIARVVLRGKEYLTSVRADQRVLALDTMFFADEIRDPTELVGEQVAAQQGTEQELTMASTVIESMSSEWRPEEFSDTYTARVEQLLQDKAQGHAVEQGEQPPQPTDVIDLTEALRRSVRGGQEHKKSDGQDVSALSKAELDERARQLGIRGRSRMKRPELAEAVTRAQAESDSGKRSRKAS